jgi:methenyltetrahydromethanopterin cyclohydrolase
VLNLNDRADALCQLATEQAAALRVASRWLDCGTEVIDFGIETPGGLAAGCRLAEICLAGLGRVELVPGDPAVWSGPAVMVTTDWPVAACLASQYAGWELKTDDYFAMASGPMRAVAGREELFDTIGHRETAGVAVGVLETGKFPTDDVARLVAEKCGIYPERIKLLVAPTSSQAGTVQIVARSVETALHKLHELKFDVTRIESGWGVAPLVPVAGDDLTGIGRTNDAILYGAHAVLYVRGEDDSLRKIGPQTPSNASSDHGRPFAEIFAGYDHDFYAVDRQLFSPAVVTFINLDTGTTLRYGEFRPDVLAESFGTANCP